MSASSEPMVGMNGSWAELAPGTCQRYICIVGGCPSGGVAKLALSTWFRSGTPFWASAPSSDSSCTGSPPLPLPLALTCWKLPAASVKPIGALAR